MHPYATDSNERKNVIFILAVLSIGFGYLLHLFINLINFPWPWWLESPSFIGIFGLCYEIFDRRLWRVKWIRKLGVVKIPDLNGRWKAEGRSIKRDENYSAEVKIKQTWTKMSIVMNTQFSSSYSITATVLVHQPGRFMLSYEYVNQPKANALPTMHSHRGTTILRIRNENLLEAEYYLSLIHI